MKVKRISDELYHYGIKGQRRGVRRYQNKDGSLTAAGKARYLDPKSNSRGSSRDGEEPSVGERRPPCLYDERVRHEPPVPYGLCQLRQPTDRQEHRLQYI